MCCFSVGFLINPITLGTILSVSLIEYNLKKYSTYFGIIGPGLQINPFIRTDHPPNIDDRGSSLQDQVYKTVYSSQRCSCLFLI